MSPTSLNLVAWPSGLRRWFKAPVSSEAWVRIPPLPLKLFFFHTELFFPPQEKITANCTFFSLLAILIFFFSCESEMIGFWLCFSVFVTGRKVVVVVVGGGSYIQWQGILALETRQKSNNRTVRYPLELISVLDGPII